MKGLHESTLFQPCEPAADRLQARRETDTFDCPDRDSDSNPAYAEQLYGKTPSYHGIGRAGAKLRDISMSDKKLNYFAKLIRRMHVEDALAQCSLQPKKAAGICSKVAILTSANTQLGELTLLSLDQSLLALPLEMLWYACVSSQRGFRLR